MQYIYIDCCLWQSVLSKAFLIAHQCFPYPSTRGAPPATKPPTPPQGCKLRGNTGHDTIALEETWYFITVHLLHCFRVPPPQESFNVFFFFTFTTCRCSLCTMSTH